MSLCENSRFFSANLLSGLYGFGVGVSPPKPASAVGASAAEVGCGSTFSP
ncbi:MAG: hypothetical protein KDD27_17325 [Saprospiraceae bacterium]|nr:hypothetical protein [Saprospiraceae bacterium]